MIAPATVNFQGDEFEKALRSTGVIVGAIFGVDMAEKQPLTIELTSSNTKFNIEPGVDYLVLWWIDEASGYDTVGMYLLKASDGLPTPENPNQFRIGDIEVLPLDDNRNVIRPFVTIESGSCTICWTTYSRRSWYYGIPNWFIHTYKRLLESAGAKYIWWSCN